jgi:dipeptidyl aminopeptidase/acylaminoacyl peptidase
MRSFLVLSCSALVLFLGGSTWIAFYPPVPIDLAGAENLDAKARHVRLPLEGGDALDGWYLPPRTGAVILLLHGYGRDHTRAWRYGGFLSRAGYGLLAFDFRSSRAAARVPTTLGHYEQADARAALAWLRAQPAARSARVGLLGESLGGSVALLLGAESPDVRALVVDGAFANGRQALEDACERWAHLPRWPSAVLLRAMGRALTGHDPGGLDAITAASALRDRPVLFIHSLKDDRLSPAHPRELWRAAGGKDPLWIIADAGHNQGWVIHRHLYEARVLAFLDHHLLGKGAGLPAGAL